MVQINILFAPTKYLEVSTMNDYIKYLTKTFVEYYDQPIDQRKQIKQERKQLKQPLKLRMFGLIPSTIEYYITRVHSVLNKRDRH